MKVAQVLAHIETFAPLGLALSWDNVGLLIGERDWEVSKAFICLDVSPNAVEEAIRNGCDLILSHHPLIFRPIKGINNPLYLKLIMNHIAVICLHTNLDVAQHSVNHVLAEKLELYVVDTLSSESGAKYHSITVYTPPQASASICEAAWAAGAGRIGDFHHCSDSHPVEGSYQAGSKQMEATTNAQETALHFMCDSMFLAGVLRAISSVHPYTTPLIIQHPVENVNPAYGLGLVGEYPQAISIAELTRKVRRNLSCPQLKLWLAGHAPEHKVQRIAICGGSGGSLLSQACAKAELFISGDISYHSFLDSSIPLIDAGHFYTEYPVLTYLHEQLAKIALPALVMDMAAHEYSQNLRCFL